MNLAPLLEKELLEGRFWTHSKTLVEGCTKVSPGCWNCWSEAMAMRFNGGKPFDGSIVERPERLLEIMPKTFSSKRKPRVWAYWNDLFHPGVSDKLRDGLHRLIGHGPDYHIICTKRPEEVVKYWQRPHGAGNLPIRREKLIYLVTMENQQQADQRAPEAVKLARMGWKVGALVEPMLGPVDLGYWPKFCNTHDFDGGFCVDCPDQQPVLSWIICGPENGKGKRPFDGQWAMRLQAYANFTGIPFFYKAGLLNGKRYIETP